MDTSLYSALVTVHGIGRWIVLVLLVIAIFNSLIAAGRPFIKSDNRTGLLLTIFSDLMLLIGIYLWFVGPWFKQIKEAGMAAVMQNPVTRFYAVEHLVGMLIAIVLIHIGKAQAKRPIGDKAKHRRTVIFYSIALLIIILSVPWPFRVAGAGRGWFY
jgi:hypothetical protein